MALSVLAPLYIQSVCGYSATVSGMAMIPGSIAMAVINPIAGKIYDKMGIKKIFLVGALLMAGSAAGMAAMKADTPLMVVTILNVFRNISTGMLMMPFVTWGMGSLKQQDVAHGTSLLTSLRTIAGAFGVAIFMVIVTLHGMTAAFLGLLLLGITEVLLWFYAAFYLERR